MALVVLIDLSYQYDTWCSSYLLCISSISSMVADTAFYVCQVLVCYYDDALYHTETYLV